MGDFTLKPSRVRRMREIDNLIRSAKELRNEYEEHRRHRLRLARKARSLANKVRRQYPNMKLETEAQGLHDQVEEVAIALYVHNNPEKSDAVNDIGIRFDSLCDFLAKLSNDTPWLDPTG